MAKCNVPDCKGEAGDMGLCVAHLAKYCGGDGSLRQYLKPGSDDGRHAGFGRDEGKKCRVPGCDGTLNCRGICLRHYTALKSKTPVGDSARKHVLCRRRGRSRRTSRRRRRKRHTPAISAPSWSS